MIHTAAPTTRLRPLSFERCLDNFNKASTVPLHHRYSFSDSRSPQSLTTSQQPTSLLTESCQSSSATLQQHQQPSPLLREFTQLAQSTLHLHQPTATTLHHHQKEFTEGPVTLPDFLLQGIRLWL